MAAAAVLNLFYDRYYGHTISMLASMYTINVSCQFTTAERAVYQALITEINSRWGGNAHIEIIKFGKKGRALHVSFHID